MAASIGTLRATLILDTENFLNGFAKAEKAAKKFSFGSIFSSLPSVFKGIGKTARSFVSGIGGMELGLAGLGRQFIAPIAGAVSLGAAIRSLSSGMEQVDRQAKLADRLGITVGEVQKLSLAADLAGTDVEVLARGMLKMGKNIGSGGMSLDQRLFQVADAFANIQDAGERARRSEAIFGKGGQEIINTLIQGGRGIRNSASAIDRFGLSINRIDAAKIESANDAWTEMKTVIGGLRNEVAVSLAPSITSMIELWLRGLEQLRNKQELLNSEIRNSTKETFRWGDAAMALIAQDNPLSFMMAGPDRAIKFWQVYDGLQKQREDAMRNAAQSGRNTGSALLGKSLLGGGSGPKTAGVFERGTMEAAKAIAGAGGSPLVKIGEQQLKVLSQIERHEAAAARKKSEQPLRASALRGGGI